MWQQLTGLLVSLVLVSTSWNDRDVCYVKKKLERIGSDMSLKEKKSAKNAGATQLRIRVVVRFSVMFLALIFLREVHQLA